MPSSLDNILNIPVILNKYFKLRVCEGLSQEVLKHLNENFLLKNIYTSYSHTNCYKFTLNSKTCKTCRKFNKNFVTAIKLKKKNTFIRRVRKPLNRADSESYKILQKRMKRYRENARRTKKRLAEARTELQEWQTLMGNVPIENINKLDDNQKLIMKEILAAAKKRDSRGNRYSENYIMQCMLLNIRCKSTYEYLKENKWMPLPSTKTIRNYMSLIDTKCGFDANFFKLLSKSLSKREARQRKTFHGVVTLDEITLRTSVTDNSRKLTYSGLVDMGEEGSQSTDINDLADHGLVVQFQSLNDKFTQPIAVFASKNSVCGDELAKIVVKAICMLENAGAKIHGVIADGAKTNRRMWTCLGINSSRDNLRTSFSHPLDEDRQVFIFSDMPHLIKCIRNRLYTKRRLKVLKRYIIKYFVYFILV